MEPQIARSASIGNPAFAEGLAAGQAAARNGEANNSFEQMEEDDRREDIEADFPAAGGGLQQLPAQTQMVDDFAETGSEAADDRALELLNEKHSALNSKTFRLRELYAQKHNLMERAGSDPYQILSDMYGKIEVSEDSEDKEQSIVMLNAVIAVFESARGHAGLRDFVSELFASQRTYYSDKEEKRTINSEIKMLTKLYDEQEKEQMLKALIDKQEQRKQQLAAKGKSKAEKKAADVSGACSPLLFLSLSSPLTSPLLSSAFR